MRSGKEDPHRVPGVVDESRGPFIEDHGVATVYTTIHCGYHQGFGGLMLGKKVTDPLVVDYVRELCATFGVSRIEELKGKRCFALYNWGEHNESMAGLESADTGRRFVIQAWRRKHYPEKVRSPIAERRDDIKRDVERMRSRIEQELERLKTLADDYVDWERR